MDKIPPPQTVSVPPGMSHANILAATARGFNPSQRGGLAELFRRFFEHCPGGACDPRSPWPGYTFSGDGVTVSASDAARVRADLFKLRTASWASDLDEPANATDCEDAPLPEIPKFKGVRKQQLLNDRSLLFSPITTPSLAERCTSSVTIDSDAKYQGPCKDVLSKVAAFRPYSPGVVTEFSVNGESHTTPISRRAVVAKLDRMVKDEMT